MPRPRLTLLAATCSLAGLALFAAPAQAIQLGLEEPHSPNAESISTTYWVMIGLAALLIVAINGALVATALRFRERRGRTPARFTAGRGALRPVIGGLAALALVVFVFGVVMTGDIRSIEASGPGGLGAQPTAQVGVKGLDEASPLEEIGTTSGEPLDDAASPEGAPLVIDAIAQQWTWRFEYPGDQAGQKTFSYGELVVPVDTTVVLNIGSTDVLHSWWVPELGGQAQATPGDVVQTWFKADEVGRYEGQSTIFSGSMYPAMRAWVEVVEVPEYEQYVEELASELNEAQKAVERVQQNAVPPEGSEVTPPP